MMGAVGSRRLSQGIYDDDGGVGGGRLGRRLKQRQQMSQRRIDDASKGLETTT